MRNKIVITGGAGFIGVNLAARLAGEGSRVVILDNLARAGAERNLAWLMRRWPADVEHYPVDIRDRAALTPHIARADAIFHFAAQVAVTDSVADPGHDLEVNLLGAYNLLTILRQENAEAPLLFASTNKVYGCLDRLALDRTDAGYFPVDTAARSHGVDERQSLEFATPYGCSKGAADQYVIDHDRSFGLRTVVFRMSCIYGPHQNGTEDQGWVAHFVRRALRFEPIMVYGDGRQVRDLLHVDDAVDAYLAAWRRIDQVRGRAFNLGGGPANAVCVNDVLRHIGHLAGRPLDIRMADWRPADQRYYVSDTRAATAALGLAPPRDWREGVAELYRWMRDNDPEHRGRDLDGSIAPSTEPAEALRVAVRA